MQVSPRGGRGQDGLLPPPWRSPAAAGGSLCECLAVQKPLFVFKRKRSPEASRPASVPPPPSSFSPACFIWDFILTFSVGNFLASELYCKLSGPRARLTPRPRPREADRAQHCGDGDAGRLRHFLNVSKAHPVIYSTFSPVMETPHRLLR